MQKLCYCTLLIFITGGHHDATTTFLTTLLAADAASLSASRSTAAQAKKVQGLITCVMPRN
jgi:hypothetical protein